MAFDRKPVHSLTSPKGTFVFPKLNEPDTKFNAAGDYSVKLSLRADDHDTQAFIAKLALLHGRAVTAAQEAFKGLKPEARKKLREVQVNDFYTTKLDEDEQPTGMVEFNFKMKASGVTKAGKAWTRKPVIFDAKGKAMSDPPAIWGGTVGKVAFEVVEGGYFVPGTGAAGISLALVAVQIIELRSGREKSAAQLGFGVEEGGFEQAEPTFSNEDSDDSGTNADF